MISGFFVDGNFISNLPSMILADFMDERSGLHLLIHVFGSFHGRAHHFELVIHDFGLFRGWELYLLWRGVVGLKERCKFVELLNCSGSPSMIKWQGNEVRG